MEWVALGVLALLLSGPPGPGDFGPPALARVELVSLRVEPASAWQGTGREVTGYLALSPVVSDSPNRPVETLATPRLAYLPGVGLNPGEFRVPADGRWHLPEPARGRGWNGFWSAQALQAGQGFVVPLYVYPLVRGRLSYRPGDAGIAVALYVTGLGWVGGWRQVWTNLDGSRRTVAFDTAYGRVTAYLEFRRG